MEAHVNGTKLFYTDSGKTTPHTAGGVVFIHGFPFDHTMWQEQAALLEPDHRVITYDQRGHGLSAAGDGQYPFELFVDDLFGLLDALKISQATLCGLSMGGYVALRAIERDSTRFRGLILCDTRSEADSNEAKLKRAANVRLIKEKGVNAFSEGFLKAIFAPASLAYKSLIVEQIRHIINTNTAAGICGTLIALATRTDTTNVLAGIKVPTLILVGAEDSITPPQAARAMHQAISTSKLTILPDAGHMSNLENPEAFNKAILHFFSTYPTL